MNIIILILLIVIGLIALLLVAALFITKEYSVERETILNKPKREVFDYVKFQKNQDHYSKWIMADPNAKKIYAGTDGVVGFTYAWDSENKNVGKGEQTIKNIVDGERIDSEINFIKPFEGTGYTRMITESISENQTKVKWGMNGRNKYPFNLMNSFIGNLLGKDLDVSLTNLKTILEK